MTEPRLRRALVALCATQITSWGILYYAFPVMLASVSADTGWPGAAAMGAFSVGAVVSALAGVVVGRLIDARGPRQVMTTGSVLGVASVLAIAASPSLPLFYAAWVLAGVAQATLLYPPAFAALTTWYGTRRVRALTTLTLVGGLASTVFAPLTAFLLDQLSWRGVYLVLAAILGIVTIPLHALALTPPWPAARPSARSVARSAARQETRRRHDARAEVRGEAGQEARQEAGGRVARPGSVVRSGPFVGLSVAMTLGAFGMYAATVNLVPLLTWRGMDTHLAAIILGLCGLGQVFGRLFYGPLAARVGPRGRTAGVLAAGAVTVVAVGVLPGPVALLIVVAVVAGAVRGMFTLLQATAVADRWGTQAFGRVNGVFTAPITTATALAPGGGALLAELAGGYVVSYCVLAALVVVGAAGAGAVKLGRTVTVDAPVTGGARPADRGA